jgi:hypothetical protein
MGKTRGEQLTIRKDATSEGIIAELVSLLDDVTADGVITEAEARHLHQWLQDNADLTLKGVEFLRTCLNHVLQDGKITAEERLEVYKSVERILPQELKRGARERRAATETMEKARVRSEKAEAKELERAERERNRPTGSANFMVAGVLYERRAELVDRFAAVGQRVFLVREPTNVYDRCAIEVRLHNGAHIGYVPREDAAYLSWMLDRVDRQEAYLTKILNGKRAPIPVIQVHAYNSDATIVGPVSQAEAPIKAATDSLLGRSSAGGCGCVTAAAIATLLGAACVAVLLLS